eukprot:gene12961-15324_t
MSETKGSYVRTVLANRPETEFYELHLIGPIDEDLANIICNGIFCAINKMQKMLLLHIHSSGGYVASGKRIIDTMKVYSSLTKGKIHTHVAVEAKSMAAVIFLCGDYRTMCTSATLMIHQVSMTDVISCKKTATSSAATSAYHTHLNQELFNLICNRCQMDFKTLTQKANAQDWYIYADEAKCLDMTNDVVNRSPFVILETTYNIDYSGEHMDTNC